MSKVINIESVRDTLLYKELRNKIDNKTEAFISVIPNLCDEASDRIKILPKYFQEYTLHDKTHFLRVTELMGKLLGAQITNLNAVEISLLILSAFFHDQGMLIEREEVTKLEKKDDFLIFRDNWYLDHPNYKDTLRQFELSSISENERISLSNKLEQLQAAMLADYLRDNHGQRSKDFIQSTYSKDKRFEIEGINISEFLGNICLSHVKPVDWVAPLNGLQYDENIGSFKVNTIFLSLVLRLADILDFDADRTPEILFKSIHFTNKISSDEWQKHRSVQGWEISKDKIRFTMYFEHPSYEKTARTFLNWIDDELNAVSLRIREFPNEVDGYSLEIPEKVDRSRIGPKNKSYIYHDLEFSLSRDEIVKLLLTNNLYQSPSILVRELLQNSLDAIRLRKALYSFDSLKWDEGKVSFRHYIDNNDEEVLECNDNGCGMDEEIITNFLGKVGRSYYRSPEFERKRAELREKEVDFEPCSQFGIGFMSCFMFGDRIEIRTRKDYGLGIDRGKPLFVEINGINGLIVIKEGKKNQEIGTSIKIYNRRKSIYFDAISDSLRLIARLKGVAMATEFPIYARCEIEGIKGDVELPPIIDKKNTFIEEAGIKNKTTFEIDLSKVDSNLRGFLRQSFLTDEKGLPVLENKEAKWELVDTKKWKDRSSFDNILVVKESKKQIPYIYYSREDNSICLDGILVCGSPGRREYAREVQMFLGNIAATVISEHPFTIDVRGKIKPELSPSREPLKNYSIMDLPFGWRRLQHLLNIGSSLIWEKVIDFHDKGMTPETFWKLLIIYNGHIENIRSKKLIEHLQLPFSNGNEWVKLSEIKSFEYIQEKLLINISGKIKTIDFSQDIKNICKAHPNSFNLNWWISQLLLSISEINFVKEESTLFLRKIFNENERPSDNTYLRSMSASVKYVQYNGLSTDYIVAVPFVNTANKLNPLLLEGFKNKDSMNKNEIVEFSLALASVISNLINDFKKEDKPFTLDVSWRPLKYLYSLYSNIQWNKYGSEFKPPYKIFVDANTTLEITDSILRKWKK